MRAVKNNLPTPSGGVEESEGPRWTRAVGIIPATPFIVIVRCGLAWDKAYSRAKSLHWQDLGREGEISASVRLFNEADAHDLKAKQEGGGFDPPPS
jgi:hypothetical protein